MNHRRAIGSTFGQTAPVSLRLNLRRPHRSWRRYRGTSPGTNGGGMADEVIAIRDGAGLLKDKDYPHWRDIDSVKEWVRTSRRGKLSADDVPAR